MALSECVMNKKSNNIKVWDKVGLYITSLWLFFLLIIVLKINIPICFDENWEFLGIIKLIKLNIISAISLIFFILGMIYCKIFNYQISGTSPTQVRVTKLKNKNYEHITFLTTYIIPFITFDMNDPRYLLTLVVLLFIIGFIYVKTDLFYANPTLALLGYHIYEVDAEFNVEGQPKTLESITIITKENLNVTNEIKLKSLDDYIYYGRKA